ncbi:MAG: DUF1552 domain-containing protein [Myxococcota bacterium]|nr:DUF1552 domain-containing protein [Myxococcota bacterium]
MSSRARSSSEGASASRRRFLRGLGAAAVGLPFLPSLVPSVLRAQETTGPKRLLCVFTHNHMPTPHWMPVGSETSFTLPRILAPLAPYQDRMLALHNLTSTVHDHPGGSHVLDEADGRGPSIDQLVAQRLGNATRIRSLELGAMCNGSSRSLSGPGVRLPPMEQPLAAFARVAGAATGDPELEALASRQTGSVVDRVASRYASLSSRLSSSERRLVDAHLSELRDLHVRVSSPAMVRACTIPEAPDVPAGSAVIRDETLMPEVTRAHIDVLATALTCDVTRVGTLMLGTGGSLVRYSWLGIDDVAHDVAHGFRNADRSDIVDADAEWAQVQTWHAEQIAYLAARLDAVPEGDGTTALDNTIIYWVSELGLGASSTHSRRDLPAVLIGGGGGYLRTGRVLDMGGRPHADLLLTLGHAMGFGDIETFGLDGIAPLDVLRA